MNTFETAQVYPLKASVDYASGSVVSKIVTKNASGNISLFAFDKGQSLSRHTAPYDAFVQVLDGKAGILINDRLFELVEGDSIIMPADIPHAVEALEKFKMLLVMIKG